MAWTLKTQCHTDWGASEAGTCVLKPVWDRKRQHRGPVSNSVCACACVYGRLLVVMHICCKACSWIWLYSHHPIYCWLIEVRVFERCVCVCVCLCVCVGGLDASVCGFVCVCLCLCVGLGGASQAWQEERIKTRRRRETFSHTNVVCVCVCVFVCVCTCVCECVSVESDLLSRLVSQTVGFGTSPWLYGGLWATYTTVWERV